MSNSIVYFTNQVPVSRVVQPEALKLKRIIDMVRSTYFIYILFFANSTHRINIMVLLRTFLLVPECAHNKQ